MSGKYTWGRLKRVGIRGEKCSFHLVCFTELEEELYRVERDYFADFTKSEKEELINSFLTVMAPFLLHHLNMDGMVPALNLKWGNTPPFRIKDEAGEEEPVVMDSHLRVDLDRYNYRLLKKFHEGAGTFSMAMVLRSLLVLVLGLVCRLGRDGFLLWVEGWLKQYNKVKAPKFREEWKELEQHMSFFKSRKVKYIGLYSSGYHQMHLYHPPDQK